MVKVDAKIVITGLICLTTIYIVMLINNKVDGTIGATIVGVIAFTIGAIAVPRPKIDNKTGVLKW